MRAANRAWLLMIGLAAASAACRQSPPEQNVANDAATPTDIEALPPDESVATPTNELNAGDYELTNVDQTSNAD